MKLSDQEEKTRMLRMGRTEFLFLWSVLFALLLIRALGGEGTCEAGPDGVCLSGDTAAATPVNSDVKIAKGSNEHGRPPVVSTSDCSDRHPSCVGFAKQGECENNPGWMIINCPSSCRACDLRDAKIRCNRNFLNISTEPVYKPGDMNSMFESIVERFSDRYNVTVMSTSPWVVVFDDFTTEEEGSALISTVEGTWERSTDTGQANEFGETGRTLSKGRTSSNAWCRRQCESHPLVQQVARKIEEVTLIPYSHYESFQILRYEIGQRYNVHHDMGYRQNKLACGPRILTFFLYLSDVEEGGETGFPRLGIEVKPKRGRAVLWPSTMNDNLEQQDARTHHEAKAVIQGVKYAANAWIHLYNFQHSNLWGCTGSFDYI